MFYKNKTPDPKGDRSKVSKTQYGSQRKGSAPGDLRANKQRNSDADKPIKVIPIILSLGVKKLRYY